MHHVIKCACGKVEVAYIPGEQADSSISSQMRSTLCEHGRLSRQHHRGRIQRQHPIGRTKALYYPTAKETGATRDEEALSARLLPQASCLLRDVLQVALQQIHNSSIRAFQHTKSVLLIKPMQRSGSGVNKLL